MDKQSPRPKFDYLSCPIEEHYDNNSNSQKNQAFQSVCL